MPTIGRSVASLRIMGDDLAPGEISDLLGCAATKSQTKDQVFRSGASGRERIARFGMWMLEVTELSPSDPDAQVAELLSKLSPDLGVWNKITGRYRADVFFGMFMAEWNEGFSLSPDTCIALGSRGIEVGFDIYGPDEEEVQPNDAENSGQRTRFGV